MDPANARPAYEHVVKQGGSRLVRWRHRRSRRVYAGMANALSVDAVQIQTLTGRRRRWVSRLLLEAEFERVVLCAWCGCHHVLRRNHTRHH